VRVFVTAADTSGSAVETAIEVAKLTAAEVGTILDSSQISVTVITPDSGSGSDSQKLGLYSSDSGVSVDVLTLAVSIVASELGIAIDSEAVIKQVLGPGENAPQVLLAAGYDNAILLDAIMAKATLLSTSENKPSLTGVGHA
jgi:hypothetical protein